MVKIKIDIGYREIVNTWALIIKHKDHYEIYCQDGSWDKWMRFNNITRCFEGV